MGGQIADWIQDFLSGRTLRVCVEGKFSKKTSVVSGVPQGTVLGPIAFLFYINDLAVNISSFVRLFADDALVYNTDRTTLQEDLRKLETWQDVWLMSFNPSKCVTMTIGTRNPPKNTFPFCGQQLEPVDSNPYLGVSLNNTLTWRNHIDEACKKAQRVLGVVRRNLWESNERVKSTAYSTLLRHHLEYASPAWDSSNQTNSQRLDRIQRDRLLDFVRTNIARKKAQ